MAFRDQWNKIKDNWLLILIALIVIFVLMGGGSFSSSISRLDSLSSSKKMGYSPPLYEKEAMDSRSMGSSNYYNRPTQDFAPEEQERKITRNAGLTVEVERGKFDDSYSRAKNIITSSDIIMLSENVNNYGTGKNKYKQASFTLQVDAEKYYAVLDQLKGIGEVTGLNDNTQDITGAIKNLEVELAVERERLARYEYMFGNATIIQDKITLNDRMFDEERTIKYLEDSLKNQGQRVSYSTISLQLNEKRSEYFDLALVKISDLARNFVKSMNALFSLISVLLPWAIAIGVIWLIVWIIKRRF